MYGKDRDTDDIFLNEIIKKKKKSRTCLIVILSIFVLLAAATAYFAWSVLRVEVLLSVEQQICVEYGTEFSAPAAKAWLSGTDLNDDVAVTVAGQVDTSVVGEYHLTYSASYEQNFYIGKRILTDTMSVTVSVVDTQPPEIVLESTPGAFTIPGDEYVEEGFYAYDDYDGDLTGAVERTVADGTVTYRVEDSSGNAVQIQRQIVYHDPVAPALELLGETEMTVDQWTVFEDPGFTAQDNCDGDLTANVTVTGQVDMETPGTYTLTYSVTDHYSNTTTATRTVTVIQQPWIPPMPAGEFQEIIEPEGKVIYLTFDDGPSYNTPRLLQILEKYNVKATFFVVNTNCIEYISEIAAAGHTVAMHSASHKYEEIYADETAYFTDLLKIQTLITQYTGTTPTILRLPGGSSNTTSMNYSMGIMTRITQRLKEMGYRYFDWNVDSRDAATATTAQEVFDNVMCQIWDKDVAIVLQHDIFDFSVEAVPMIIQWGLARGYTFATLDPSSPVCEHDLKN